VSPYIIAGYVVALSALTLYSVTLILRVRAARHRLERIEIEERATGAPGEGTSSAADQP
jgi:hypothetical protein